jgi:hypothetical protein
MVMEVLGDLIASLGLLRVHMLTNFILQNPFRIGPKPVKNFTASYGTQRFIIMFIEPTTFSYYEPD